MELQYPRFFARFYDVIYQNLRDSVDNNFFLQEIEKTDGSILEVGVGTGRLFIEALNRQADIYGIDMSTSMIEVLKSKINRQHYFRIEENNVLNFQHENHYCLIIAPFRVFMHLLTKEEQIQAINNIYDHLHPGGRFIFDTFVPDPDKLKKGAIDEMDFEGEYMPGRKLRRYVTTKPDLINQRIDIAFRLKWDEDDGFKQERWEVPLRFFFRYELEHLIERSKFQENYHIYGDYSKNELTKNSTDFVIECRKQ
ncbi:MAG: class I SAM-dependent methyltransferase [Bacteroidota bacterium]